MSNAAETSCPHCDPTVVGKDHIPEKIGMHLIAPMMRTLDPLMTLLSMFPRTKSMTEQALFIPTFRLALAIKLAREEAVQDTQAEIYNRTLVVAQEAKNRGLRINVVKVLGLTTHHFSIETPGGKRYFERLPLPFSGAVLPIDVDDKSQLKDLLLAHHLPTPKGEVFRDVDTALEYVRAHIGFPVVVKPRSGSLSKHVSSPVRNPQELSIAIAIARMITREFIVEEYVPGKVHRVTMVDGVLVASCWREPANIVGDGEHTIRELIARKNQDPRRGGPNERNYTLHKILTGKKTEEMLSAQGVHFESIPQQGEKISVHDKVVLAAGADIHDNTEELHPVNIRLFTEVARLCGVPLIGIDCIAADLSIPYTEQPFGIIEVNSHPYIDMHHVPSTGKVRNVAGALLDLYLAQS